MRRKTTFSDLILGVGYFLLKEARKELDQRVRDQKEKERSKKLRESNIDVEFKVIEQNMNLKEIKNLRKYDCVIREVQCTNCGIKKFIIPYFIDEYRNIDARKIDAISKCCKNPDYKL